MIKSHGKYFLKYYPQHMILLSLIFLTIIGALILRLPVCRLQPISFIDLLFMSVSLTTVTGHLSVPLEHFSNTGHAFMLLLIQLGGLGLMTLSLCFIYMFSNLGIYTQMVASEVLNLKSFKDTKDTLLFMLKFTIIVECIGIIAIFPTLYKIYPFQKALFLSAFHSISSFCNAGFSLFPQKMSSFKTDPFIIIVTTLLMIMGGLGFVTWNEIFNKIITKEKRSYGISWHTKLVLKIYFLSTLISAILFWLIENNHLLAQMPFFQKTYTVFFVAISMKSTGFTLFPFSSIQLASLLLTMIIMFIGAGPLSTGSGIKTSVFAIYLAVIKAAIQGKPHAILHGRHIVDSQVYKAMAIILLSLSWIIVTTFCLLIAQADWSFINILFSIVSAFSNNGISIESMSTLNNLSKLFMIITMIIGRIGALALILSMKRIADSREFLYPKEHVILG